MKIQDHVELYKREDYKELFEKKKKFEIPCTEEEVNEVLEYTKTEDYREKNFARKALTINPAKACQPLGALLCALGFKDTLPFVHGSQGCVAYFRSHLSRHFKEPVPAVSSSMTEDAAVFGGLSNMMEGLENAYALYKPKMFAISTTCMAEVIGDDLNAFIKKTKQQGLIPANIYTPYANTPSFTGSHINGYDNMLKGILSYLTAGLKTSKSDRINIILGFDTYTGNYREIKRILNIMGVPYIMLADISDTLDSPNEGNYEMYPGGTSIEEAIHSINSIATVALQKYSTQKTGEFIKEVWRQPFVNVPYPVGIANTDLFIDVISQLSGKTVPDELIEERGRVVDAMIDSYSYIHGKRFALIGDPDLLIGLISFIMELGGIPVHIVCTNGDEEFEKDAYAILKNEPLFGSEGKVYIKKDMWHLRSLLFTEPVDLLIGNSYCKALWKDTGIPLIRVGFPIFDRHHMHRFPIIGYTGALNLLTLIVNTILDEMDRQTKDSPSFDLIR
ncbi:nitrogenase molybdenum-iron protein beta chain [Thermodesulfovibrio aggregans]|uniref:Nitrogenase molybdenum-iron protein beta chain n=1 Tax=Thermodesulfovibrio aggregans TaxID=86166 RepID=A0A0U9HRB3_9BACT|nr:nitrogenase molybdenum-iron protein subunit beta [Thermodesulfovibrio aggregans]GAQ95547.1 nitrogenase molybdenum-iron protein beta chain [Thermodesulfovibrio aggregans]